MIVAGCRHGISAKCLTNLVYHLHQVLVVLLVTTSARLPTLWIQTGWMLANKHRYRRCLRHSLPCSSARLRLCNRIDRAVRSIASYCIGCYPALLAIFGVLVLSVTPQRWFPFLLISTVIFHSLIIPSTGPCYLICSFPMCIPRLSCR